MMGMLQKSTLLVFLWSCAGKDLRTKTLPVWLLLAGSFLGVAWQIILVLTEQECLSWIMMAGGAATGFLLLFIGKLMPGSVGSGDGFLFAVTGIFLGWEENLALLWLSFMSAMMGAGILVMAKKADRKTKIALSPFVLIGYVVLLAVL